jgi:hypothetical protein
MLTPADEKKCLLVTQSEGVGEFPGLWNRNFPPKNINKSFLNRHSIHLWVISFYLKKGL